MMRLLRPGLLLALLLVVCQSVLGAEARDEARLKAQLGV